MNTGSMQGYAEAPHKHWINAGICWSSLQTLDQWRNMLELPTNTGSIQEYAGALYKHCINAGICWSSLQTLVQCRNILELSTNTGSMQEYAGAPYKHWINAGICWSSLQTLDQCRNMLELSTNTAVAHIPEVCLSGDPDPYFMDWLAISLCFLPRVIFMRPNLLVSLLRRIRISTLA